jgi:hypothetical protein
VRSYDQRAIAPEDLDRILETAAHTLRRQPAGVGLRRLHRPGAARAACQGEARRPARRQLGSDDRAGGPEVRRRPDARLIQFDLGQATMSVMLAAADLGIGSAHAGVHDQEVVHRGHW